MNLAVEAAEFHVKPFYNNPHQKRACTLSIRGKMERSRTVAMAVYLTSSLFMGLLIVSTSALDESQPDKDIITTMQEMQRASYFTFEMLLNMVHDRIPRHTTFLLPSDRALSKASIPENKTLEFILRHSIPSALSSDYLLHSPNGTFVPTHQQDYVLKIVKRGAKGFYLNNVQLVHTDICTAGSFFRCHGIYGVLTEDDGKITPTCSQTNPPTERAVGPTPGPSQPSPPPLIGSQGLVPTISPPLESNDGTSKSGSSDRISQGLVTTIVLCMVSTMKL